MGRRNQALVVFQHQITKNEELSSSKRQILKTNVLHLRTMGGLLILFYDFFFKLFFTYMEKAAKSTSLGNSFLEE